MGNRCSSPKEQDVLKVETGQKIDISFDSKEENKPNESTRMIVDNQKQLSSYHTKLGDPFNCNEDTCQHIKNIISYLSHHFKLTSNNNRKLIDVMSEIDGDYTVVNLMRDFIHIRTCHYNFTSINNEDIGNCTDECVSKQRYRNRKLYTDENNEFNNDIQEINLQQSFDVIHCNLLHDDVNSEANSSKFITSIEDEKDAGDEKQN